jgi:hypothetical protein
MANAAARCGRGCAFAYWVFDHASAIAGAIQNPTKPENHGSPRPLWAAYSFRLALTKGHHQCEQTGASSRRLGLAKPSAN